MKLNEQQEKALREFALLQKGGEMALIAYAGAGKTTTIKEIVKFFAPRKVLYLVYNKSMQKEAEEKFKREGIKNAYIRTFHSLAYQYLPKHLKPSVKSLRLSQIKEVLEAKYSDYQTRTLWILSQIVLSEIKDNWRERLRLEGILLSQGWEKDDIRKISLETRDRLKEQGLIDFDEMLHLLKEKLEKGSKIKRDKIVIIDEAQDANSLQIDIARLLITDGGRLLLVGDPHQNIYSWRGAVNQIMWIEKKLYLTNSYRFRKGSAIERYANVILLKAKKAKYPIRGAGDPPHLGIQAYIARTNSTIIEEALNAIGSGYEIRFTRPLEELLSLPIDIYNYFFEKKPPKRHLWLLSFSDLKEFEKYLKESEDVESQAAMKLIQEHGDPSNLYEVLSSRVSKKARIIFSTAHSAKGLEFDEVYLLDDFQDITERVKKEFGSFDNLMKEYRKKNPSAVEVVEEINLQYVAITRAKHKVSGIPPWIEELEELGEGENEEN